jgi:uncharacterized membrane protein YcaP (DUF421 family)
VEGTADYLVRAGRLNIPVLERELISISELEAAARKQGIASLNEVETATLEPGGAISFIVHTPSLQEKHQRELVRRLDELTHELALLRKQQGGKNNHAAAH